MGEGPKSRAYREALSGLDRAEWDGYLLANSGLPGPRGNIELAQVAADLGDEAQFRSWLSWDAGKAPTNTPEEFLSFCGAIGLGRLVAEGRIELLDDIRQCASDPRWRMREGVAMALQRIGRADAALLLDALDGWANSNWLECRAVAAGLCEPDLLDDPEVARQTLDLLDRITGAMAESDHRDEDYKVLRQGLAYCWSVAVVALPEVGKPLMEGWMTSMDADIRWMMKQNLNKKRLQRADAAWVDHWADVLGKAAATSS